MLNAALRGHMWYKYTLLSDENKLKFVGLFDVLVQ